MKNNTTNIPSTIYVEKVENLYIDEIELTPGTHLYIEKVENLYASRVEPAITGASYDRHQTSHHEPPTSLTLTNSQQVLTVYYVLDCWGVRPRINADIADIARFMHLLTGRAYTCVDNSVFYKKLKRAPNFKKDQGLIKDLEVINKSLLALDLKEVSLKVDNELRVARQEAKYSS